MDKNQGPVWDSLEDMLRHIADDHQKDVNSFEDEPSPNSTTPHANPLENFTRNGPQSQQLI